MLPPSFTGLDFIPTFQYLLVSSLIQIRFNFVLSVSWDEYWILWPLFKKVLLSDYVFGMADAVAFSILGITGNFVGWLGKWMKIRKEWKWIKNTKIKIGIWFPHSFLVILFSRISLTLFLVLKNCEGRCQRNFKKEKKNKEILGVYYIGFSFPGKAVHGIWKQHILLN